MTGCPESPGYLIFINRIEEAREALQKLRPNANIDKEFFGMVEGQLGLAAAESLTSTDMKPGFDETDLMDNYNEEHIEDGINLTKTPTSMAEGPGGAAGVHNTLSMVGIVKDLLIPRIALTFITSTSRNN